MDNKKIEIFYRGCYYPNDYLEDNKERPYWFHRNLIFDNLLATMDSNLSNLNVIIDTFRYGGDYNKIKTVFETEIKSGTDKGSFLELMKILQTKDFDPETIIYIIENDYLHRHKWCDILLEGFEHGDYVTLYDHLDKYMDYSGLKSEIYLTESCHWRTIPSTTNTFAVKYKTLMEDMDLHIYYAEFGIQGQSWDHGKFMSIGEKGRKLISSIPGYSTHCNNYLSPHTNWINYV